MSWNIIVENKREFADTSYYLKAEKNCNEGIIILKINWVKSFMYDLTIQLHRKIPKRKFFFFKDNKPDLLYSTLIFYNDRVEKYGHQIMRMTKSSPIDKLKRLDSFQKDSVLNYNIGEKHNKFYVTTLPEKDT